MKKKSTAILVALCAAFIPLIAGCNACGGETGAALDGRMPWYMPTLYEFSEFKIEKYLMKVDSDEIKRDRLLAEGTASFTLEEAESSGNARLSICVTVTYNGDDANGTSRNLTDSMNSEVVFSKTTLLPVTSKKSVKSAKRVGAEDMSYEVTVDYENAQAVLNRANQNKPETKSINIGSQTFDNEQLFFAMRAFSALAPGSSQSFRLLQPYQSFVYDRGTYPMGMTVAGELTEFALDFYKNDNLYGMELGENSKPKVNAMCATVSISEENRGPAIKAYYSSQPFKISTTISTNKVLVGITETSYGATLNQRTDTFYTLSDYRASTVSQ